MGELRPAGGIAEADNVKRRLAWLQENPGASITGAGEWWTARDAAGILLQRRQDLGELMDALERQ